MAHCRATGHLLTAVMLQREAKLSIAFSAAFRKTLLASDWNFNAIKSLRRDPW
jgi:hypothetical protein